ncbi:MAG: DUF4388 domain-containing protein [Syntrophaceae bacterium]
MNNIKLVVTNDGMSEGENDNLKTESHVSPMGGLSVGSFIQLISMDQQTCLVEVYHSANKRGTFYFVEGVLYNAVCGNLEGEEAAMEMITWDKVRININNDVTANEIVKKIEKGLLALLMESSRRRDETAWDDQLKTSGESIVYDDEDPSVATVLNNDDKQVRDIKQTEEKSSEAGSKSEIVKILDKTPGIIEYCIFDERDIIQDKSVESNGIMNIAPSLHFNLTDSLCDLVGGGSLKYLGFSTRGGVRYLMVRINKSQVVIGLNPGIKPGDFLNEILTHKVIK